jgi:hypothetical protein
MRLRRTGAGRAGCFAGFGDERGKVTTGRMLFGDGDLLQDELEIVSYKRNHFPLRRRAVLAPGFSQTCPVRRIALRARRFELPLMSSKPALQGWLGMMRSCGKLPGF